MIKKKIYIFLGLFITILLIFTLINNIVIYDYIALSLILLSYIIRLLMYKTRKKIYDNSKTNYPKKSYKNIIFNVFMSKKEKEIKLKTDWILDPEKIKEKYK